MRTKITFIIAQRVRCEGLIPCRQYLIRNVEGATSPLSPSFFLFQKNLLFNFIISFKNLTSNMWLLSSWEQAILCGPLIYRKLSIRNTFFRNDVWLTCLHHNPLSFYLRTFLLYANFLLKYVRYSLFILFLDSELQKW